MTAGKKLLRMFTPPLVVPDIALHNSKYIVFTTVRPGLLNFIGAEQIKYVKEVFRVL